MQLKNMVAYCENIFQCRRQQQLAYFGEIFHDSRWASLLPLLDLWHLSFPASLPKGSFA